MNQKNKTKNGIKNLVEEEELLTAEEKFTIANVTQLQTYLKAE